MSSFWLLTKYEYKKLLQKKLVWITMAVLIAACFFLNYMQFFASVYSENGTDYTALEWVKKMIKESRQDTGTKIDEALLKDIRSGKEISSDLYNQIFFLSGGFVEDMDLAEKELYDLRMEGIKAEWEEKELTSGEKAYLSGLEEKIEKPLVYEYTGGFGHSINFLAIIAIMQTLLIAVCVPSIFSEEHTRRTDQLILCTELGRKWQYLAKLVTGVTFSIVTSILLCVCMTAPIFIVYGFDGAGTSAQMIWGRSSWLLNAGQIFGISILLCLTAAVLHSVFAMVMSERFRSNITPMAVMMGVMLVCLLAEVPPQYRVLAQIYMYLPGRLIGGGGTGEAFGVRLLPFFGTYLAPWQAALLIWPVLCVIGAFLGYRFYKKYQVSGR